MQNTTHLHSTIKALFYQTAHWSYTNNLLLLIQNDFDKSLRFNSPNPSLSMYLSKWPPYCQGGLELDEFTRFLSQFSYRLDSIYSPPTSSWLWHHPIGWIKFLFFLSWLWFDLTYFLPTYSLSWSHSDIIHPFKLHMKITTCRNLQRDHFVFVCRHIIIYVENISPVLTYCSRYCF